MKKGSGNWPKKRKRKKKDNESWTKRLPGTKMYLSSPGMNNTFPGP